MHQLSGEISALARASVSVEARKELHRIIQSAEFRASDRNRRFLSYVVEETLAGRAYLIKAYTIAVDVFGRSSTFDPTADPIVRIEARQLRRELERFYLTEGKGDTIEILMPKGSYVPEFQTASKAGPPTSDATQPTLGVFVAPFSSGSDQRQPTEIAQWLSRHLTIELARRRNLEVFAPLALQSGESSSPELPASFKFVVTGSLNVFDDQLCATVMLLDGQSGRVLHGRSFRTTLQSSPPKWNDLAGVCDNLTACVVVWIEGLRVDGGPDPGVAPIDTNFAQRRGSNLR